jgi:hypothetical protein
MGDFSPREIADIVFIYGFCNGNALKATREYRRRFPNRRIPTHTVFTSTFRRLGEAGISRAVGAGATPRENVVDVEEAVIDAVLDSPTISTRRIALQLGISQNFAWRTLHREQLHPYHYTGVQGLHPGDAQQRLIFCQQLLQKLNENPHFISMVLWTDEAIFTRDGINNFRNFHHWSLNNPHAKRSRRFQQRFSVNVWGGIINGTLLDLQELDDRMNANRYRDFLEHHLHNLLEDVPLNVRQHMYFQHDGAPPHNGRCVTEWLNNNFLERWFGRFGPLRWPARSPDLNPLDFFLWGCLKQSVYREEVNTKEQLQQRISEAAAEIRQNYNMENVYLSLIRRCNACIQAGGEQFEHLL